MATYGEAVRGLLDGGADLLLVETIFDTLNAKAALFAIDAHFEAVGFRVPVMISGTITDASGRTLSGQTTEAFWNSVAHGRPLSVGLNCALGAKALRQYVQELSRVSPAFVSTHPNAGLPNEFGQYDESPEYMAGDPAGIRRERAGEPGGRMLRDYSGPHQGHRRGGGRTAAAASRCPAAPPPPQRTGAADHRPRKHLRQRGRADQRHRVAQVRQAGSGRRLRAGPGDRPPAGGERRPDDRRQHGRGDAGLGGRR